MKRKILLLVLISHSVLAQPAIGIVAPMRMDSLIARSGYSFLVESVQNLVSPKSVDDNRFENNLKQMAKLKTPIYALNIFIPGEIKVVGPSVKEAVVLAYVEKVFERSQKAGIKLIVWGSGTSRKVPTGFSPTMAKLQFIELARKVATLAARYGVVLALENLNQSETNFITSVHEAFEIVTLVNHPNFRLCADLYHMQVENEPVGVLLSVKDVLVHCDLAEKENRNPPGAFNNFTEYFKLLKQINYSGAIVLECRWTNFPDQITPAYQSLQNQLNSVWRP